jgi:hypothetical protein
MMQNENDQVDDESDDDDENEEKSPISTKRAIDGLETFINYFEQQDDSNFNFDDLRNFKKYMRIIRVKEFNAKKQGTLDTFFKK